jgi:hypothetical protein
MFKFKKLVKEKRKNTSIKKYLHIEKKQHKMKKRKSRNNNQKKKKKNNANQTKQSCN